MVVSIQWLSTDRIPLLSTTSETVWRYPSGSFFKPEIAMWILWRFESVETVQVVVWHLITQHIHNRNVTDSKVQVLVYPSIQKLDTNTLSYQTFTSFFWRHDFLPDVEKVSQILWERRIMNVKKNTSKASMLLVSSMKALVWAGLRTQSFYQGKMEASSGDASFWGWIEGIFTVPRYSPFSREDIHSLTGTYIQTCGYDMMKASSIMKPSKHLG